MMEPLVYSFKQECTRWNVSPSLLIIDIMLIVLNIKLYYHCHINLTLTKKTKHEWMNYEHEVKVRWTMSGRHVQLTILPYNKYSWPIAYSLRKTNQLIWTKKDNSNFQRIFHKALVLGDSTTILDKER